MPATAVLYVESLERLRAFYAGCFDLAPLEEKENAYVVLGSDAWELTLVAMPREVARQAPVPDPPVRRERVPVKLGFAVRSIDAVRPTLERLGGTADDPATEWEFRGLRRCDAADPEGNVIQLLELVARPPTT